MAQPRTWCFTGAVSTASVSRLEWVPTKTGDGAPGKQLASWACSGLLRVERLGDVVVVLEGTADLALVHFHPTVRRFYGWFREILMTRRCFEILTPATLWLWLAISGAAAQETVLFSFNGADGASPQASLLRNQGKLFGTTLAGGSAGGFGTVFELSPATGGGWIEETIYRFAGGTDGSTPFGNLVADVYGNLYGTTYDGGANGDYGTAFELSPTQGGKWTKKVIYNFGAYPTDGQAPRAGLIFNSNGHLYGTTYFGGKWPGWDCLRAHPVQG